MPKKIKKNDQKLWKDSHTAKLKIRLFNEVFIIHVSLDMTVKELKKLVELETGILYDLQRLTYLDEGLETLLSGGIRSLFCQIFFATTIGTSYKK